MRKIILILTITSTALLTANQYPNTQKNLSINQADILLMNDFKKLSMSSDSSDANISQQDFKKIQNLKAKMFLMLIEKTGGKIYLFNTFEKEFIKNKLTFRSLNVITADAYLKLKSNTFKILVNEAISKKHIAIAASLIQKGGINLDNLNLTKKLKNSVIKELKIVSNHAKKEIEKMLKTKETIVGEKFVTNFLKNLELVDFSKNTTFSKDFFTTISLYHQIIINEDSGVKKTLLERLYQKMQVGNVNLAQLPLTL